jgi:hypothetical protein
LADGIGLLCRVFDTLAEFLLLGFIGHLAGLGQQFRWIAL